MYINLINQIIIHIVFFLFFQQYSNFEWTRDKKKRETQQYLSVISSSSA